MKCGHRPSPDRAAGSREQSKAPQNHRICTIAPLSPRHGAAPRGTFQCVSIDPAAPGLPQQLTQRTSLKIKQNKRGEKKKKRQGRLESVCDPAP